MSGQETSARRWELTDEEWCELCLMIVDMDAVRGQLQATLLADERPTLNQLWIAMGAYRHSSENFFEYLAERLRLKAGIEKRRAA